MPDPTSKQRRNAVVAVTAAVVLVALAVVIAVWLTSASGPEEDASGRTAAVPLETGTIVPGEWGDLLPEPMGGQQAIDALGARIAEVAEINAMTSEQLRDLLLRDASVEVAPSGRLLYDDELTPPPTSG